ncbi:MAG: hypothetical protein ONB48_05595 [candidate division KSB1 bacterium]|nr:hypothetical protein [candidate division KSB1 bacterium]MDZ7273021.1 hypothetical protein [candidate division KSB1 bacterium]MDZ7285124.1 hypothetical protein [candidate division KSB1 bacterium]MDZ7298156.1 hypothetical protein [candidate division KSB1 bacterium]MDZ7306910.1 hypothetical protein [candidate division KSB1 bacterium]
MQGKRFHWGRWLAGLIVIPLILVSLYTWLMLTWSYSSGERAGYVQKLSKKGWIFKTWEGELALATVPGVMPEKFYFSVRDDAVAEKINRTMGKRVALSYEQHVGLPVDWFGETEYFITDVKAVED